MVNSYPIVWQVASMMQLGQADFNFSDVHISFSGIHLESEEETVRNFCLVLSRFIMTKAKIYSLHKLLNSTPFNIRSF